MKSPRLLAALAAAALMCASGAKAQTIRYAALGDCQLSFTGATKLTSCSNGIPVAATYALITLETNGVRYRDDPDGTAPSASVGWPMSVGDVLMYTGPLSKITFIPQTGTSVLDVLFYQ